MREVETLTVLISNVKHRAARMKSVKTEVRVLGLNKRETVICVRGVSRYRYDISVWLRVQHTGRANLVTILESSSCWLTK